MSVVPVICENQQCQECRVTVSVLRGSVILGRSELLGETVGWQGITDRRVMEGRGRERAL
jgi:hypothetical protein